MNRNASLGGPTSQPQRVHEVCGAVQRVGVEVRAAALKPRRVFGNEPLVYWAVVSRPIKVQPRAVVFPARVLEAVRARRPADRGVAEGFVSVLSLNGAGRIRQGDRAPERVRERGECTCRIRAVEELVYAA